MIVSPTAIIFLGVEILLYYNDASSAAIGLESLHYCITTRLYRLRREACRASSTVERGNKT